MNTIDFEFFTHDDDESSISSEIFLAIIDGKPTGHTLCSSYLEASLMVGVGVFTLFGCACSESDCDDYEVLVRHDGDVIVWESMRHTIMGRVTTKMRLNQWSREFREFITVDAIHFPLFFSKADYRRVIDQMRLLLKKCGKLEDHDASVQKILRSQEEYGQKWMQVFSTVDTEEDEDEYLRRRGPLGSYEKEEFSARVRKAESWFDFFHLVRLLGGIRGPKGENHSARTLIKQLRGLRKNLVSIEEIPERYGFREKARELLHKCPNEPERTLDMLRHYYNDEALTEGELIMGNIYGILRCKRRSSGLTLEEIFNALQTSEGRKKGKYGRDESTFRPSFTMEEIQEGLHSLSREGIAEQRDDHWFSIEEPSC